VPDPLELSDQALVTLDDARGFLSLADTDTNEDEALVQLIEAASLAIMSWTTRQFAPATNETRTFDYDGSGFLNLADNDLREVTSVTIGTTHPHVLEPREYALRPKPAKHGVHTFIEFRHRGHHPHPRPHLYGLDFVGDPVDDLGTEVTITGSWGFAAVPRDVRMATMMQVAAWQRGGRMAFTRAYNPESGAVEGEVGLSGAVKALLGTYKRPVVG